MKNYLLLPLVFLSACASIVDSKYQHIIVDTDPAIPSNCEIHNDKGGINFTNTPRSLTVIRAYSPLQITCSNSEGYSGITNVESKVNPVVVGNVLVGGAVGAGVDMVRGAAYAYPERVVVPMTLK